jgi:hypothetical protein
MPPSILLAAVFLLIAYLVRTSNPVVSALVALLSAGISAVVLGLLAFGTVMLFAFLRGQLPFEGFEIVSFLLLPAFAAGAILFGSIRLILQAVRRMRVEVTPPPPPAPPHDQPPPQGPPPAG